MPSATMTTTKSSSTILVSTHFSASALLKEIGGALSRRNREANVILPILANSAKAEDLGMVPSSPNPQFWMVLRSQGEDDDADMEIDFVLSCTNGSLGTYPVFIWCGHPVNKMDAAFVNERITVLVRQLLATLHSTRRVYSVFAPARITKAFAVEWSTMTGHEIVTEPYYHASLCALTAASFQSEKPGTIQPTQSYSIRKARPEDLSGVANLCYEFALTCDPFVLTKEAALKEAHYLVGKGIAYVLEVEGQIASLVAVTRSCNSCATITKVVTHPGFLSKGWAKRLVREVCTQLLREGKKHIALYVCVSNIPAQKVYTGVGFMGVSPASQDPNMDSEWLELGFQDSDLGHW